ncbi:MAG TPA: hypothetical protein VHO70_16425 [Chitinispirillaceae bacterium]|nr:hypothetical protein [Chitinispirillaceae bacterium]
MVFSKWATDGKSGSYVNFYTGNKIVDVFAYWDFDSYFYPLDFKIYLRKRNENEYGTKQLSAQPFTGCIAATLRKSTYARGKIVADYTIIDSCGNVLKNITASAQEDYLVSIGFETIPIIPSELFFWQAEFYLIGDTLRLPEKPGIWCF